MADNFVAQNTVIAPARSVKAITPSDAIPLDPVPKSIRVGTGGTLIVRCVDDAWDTPFKNVANGEVLDIRPLYIRATGTTAADIVAFNG